MIWVDNYIIFSKDLSVITNIVNVLKENFDEELEENINGGNIPRYLGIVIERNKDKFFEMKQHFLIDGILALLEIDEKVNHKSTPVVRPLLHKYK